ncbi:hypothetical protein Lsan_4102 [Legionella santicrucis]|uniref:Uncharacterized protein n=1 Tax=Legionella santicrucis TaxID=45074 RepID=A0A0W0Y9S4_9GAMM|nr:hypothetical protein [Legionella santicrucis]KTD53692.1 hypothetical protein Lsan_4102 [Legionella santicrucis]
MKDEVIHELKTKYHEYFESKLAGFLIKNAQNFYSMQKISKAILLLLNENKSDVIKAIDELKVIKKELYEVSFYGHLSGGNKLTAPDIFAQIIKVLSDEYSDFSSIMLIHSVFNHHIFDQLSKQSMNESEEAFKQRKVQISKKIYAGDTFKNRRNEIEIKHETTTHVGINKNKAFSNRVKDKTTEHEKAMYKMVPILSSGFFKAISDMDYPFISGPSGHTALLLHGAMLYGNLSHDELKEYSLACYAFLTAGGNHSFHEVMLIAKKLGVAYEDGVYQNFFSAEIKKSSQYQDLANEFPEFLEKDRSGPIC